MAFHKHVELHLPLFLIDFWGIIVDSYVVVKTFYPISTSDSILPKYSTVLHQVINTDTLH